MHLRLITHQGTVLQNGHHIRESDELHDGDKITISPDGWCEVILVDEAEGRRVLFAGSTKPVHLQATESIAEFKAAAHHRVPQLTAHFLSPTCSPFPPSSFVSDACDGDDAYYVLQTSEGALWFAAEFTDERSEHKGDSRQASA